MADSGMERRLAAIVAIDVAGYSRLMGADEEGTIARLKEHRLITDPIGLNHGARIVGSAGDGLLLEFPSVVEAVACAVEMQAIMTERNADLADDEKMLYRIGINLGDVLVDTDGDIFGDGVNVAARIEALAEPGGICISRNVRNQVRDRMEVAFEDMGEVEVKNITRPVRVFRVLADGESAAGSSKAKPKWLVPAIAAAVLLIAVIGGGAWWWSKLPDFEPADPKKFAYKLPDQPSIAVLPFDNLTGDESNQYLADGFVETLITELARHPDLFVIARNSSFSFRGMNKRNTEIAETLGVRYILEGSFQRLGDRLRINIQLVDAINGFHIWSDRYDRPALEFFKLQDDLIRDLVINIAGRGGGGVFLAERRRVKDLKPIDLTAMELWEKSTQAFMTYTEVGRKRAGVIAHELIKKAPNHPRGYAALAYVHLFKVWNGQSKEPAKDFEKCLELANKSIDMDRQDYVSHWIQAWCLSASGRPEDAAPAMRRAYELNPADVLIQRDYANLVLAIEGNIPQAMKTLKRFLRLNPAQLEFVYHNLGAMSLASGKFSEAAKFSEQEKIQNAFVIAQTTAAFQLSGQIGRQEPAQQSYLN